MDNNKKHIIKGLTSNLEGKSGFTTPKNYFDDVEDSFFTKVSESKLPKQTGFEVSTSYFDNLEETILDKLNPKKEVKVISFKDRVLKFIPIAAAASVVIFISINFFFKNTSTVTLDDISTTEIESWYENGYGEINNNDLVLSFDDEDFDDDELLISSINDADIENYLDNIDPSTLGKRNTIK